MWRGKIYFEIHVVSLKAIDEGAPKKSFPSEPLITLQY